MKPCLSFVITRFLLVAGLLAGLGACSVFHPHRLPNPPMSAEFAAQRKATAQARKDREKAAKQEEKTRKSHSFFKNFKKKTDEEDTEEAATDVSSTTPAAGAAAPVVAAAPPEARTLPERSTVRYDKHELMKKPAYKRLRLHKHRKPFRPWKSIRNYFKYGRHAKPDYSPDHRPAAPAPDDAPDAAPDAPAKPTPAPGSKP